MDVFEAIKNRRSIRVFERKVVSEEQVERLIDAARHAPSAGNIQPWEFVIVRNLQIKQQLSVAALGQAFIEKAPVVIVVCANEARSGQGYGSRGVNPLLHTRYCCSYRKHIVSSICYRAWRLLGWSFSRRNGEANLKHPQSHETCCNNSCWISL